jgi:hypothetical protein
MPHTWNVHEKANLRTDLSQNCFLMALRFVLCTLYFELCALYFVLCLLSKLD